MNEVRTNTYTAPIAWLSQPNEVAMSAIKLKACFPSTSPSPILLLLSSTHLALSSDSLGLIRSLLYQFPYVFPLPVDISVSLSATPSFFFSLLHKHTHFLFFYRFCSLLHFPSLIFFELPFPLSLCLISIFLSIFTYLSLRLFIYLPVDLFIYPPICPFIVIFISIYLSIYLSFCLSISLDSFPSVQVITMAT